MRDNTNVIVIVGGRGTGKTTFGMKLIDSTPQPKVLVVNTFIHPAYADWPKITIKQLPKWKGGKYYLHGSNYDAMFEAIDKHVHDTFIVIEDSAKVVHQNPQDSVRRICLDSKQKNNDVIFMYHSFSEVPPKLYRWLDFIQIFKTAESERDIRAKVPYYSRVLDIYRSVLKSSNKHESQTFQVN